MDKRDDVIDHPGEELGVGYGVPPIEPRKVRVVSQRAEKDPGKTNDSQRRYKESPPGVP